MKKWFVFLAVVTPLSSACFAQDKPTAKKEQQAKQKQTKEQSAPMDPVKQKAKKPPVVKFSMGMLESGRIDPGYMGIPAAELIDAIEMMTGVKKREFESTADYNARRSAALAGKLFGDSSIEDILAFVIPLSNDSRGLGYKFNADTGDVNLYMFTSTYSPLNGIGAPDYATNRRESKGLDKFPLSTKIVSKSTYQGSNAYGATVTVVKTIISELGIAANFAYSKPTDPMIASQFKLENSRAAQELPALKALIVMKLADPYIVYNFKHVEPKRDNPVEISVQEKFLTGNVIGIVFYSGLTGEIFARLPETFGKPESKVESVPEDKPVSVYGEQAKASAGAGSILRLIETYNAPPYPKDPLLTEETYDYRKDHKNAVPPTLTDTFIVDLWQRMIKDLTILGITINGVSEDHVMQAMDIYLQSDWKEIAGYRPWTHWNFIRSLNQQQRDRLAKDVVAYMRDKGVKEGN